MLGLLAFAAMPILTSASDECIYTLQKLKIVYLLNGFLANGSSNFSVYAVMYFEIFSHVVVVVVDIVVHCGRLMFGYPTGESNEKEKKKNE